MECKSIHQRRGKLNITEAYQTEVVYTKVGWIGGKKIKEGIKKRGTPDKVDIYILEQRSLSRYKAVSRRHFIHGM